MHNETKVQTKKLPSSEKKCQHFVLVCSSFRYLNLTEVGIEIENQFVLMQASIKCVKPHFSGKIYMHYTVVFWKTCYNNNSNKKSSHIYWYFVNRIRKLSFKLNVYRNYYIHIRMTNFSDISLVSSETCHI